MTINNDHAPTYAASLEALLQQAHDYALQYISSIDQRRVYPAKDDIARLASFDEPLAEAPCNASDLLSLLHLKGSPATVAQTGGRYFGFVNGAVNPAPLAAKWLADVWDQNPALYVMSPTVSRLEKVCEQWLVQLLDLPEDTALGLVGGSSVSILCGLAAGRNELLRRMDWEVNAKGLFGAPEIRVLVGAQAHAAVFKALALLGLGRDRVEIVTADKQGRMRADCLPELDQRCLLITQAGNVNSGAFDPIDEICDRARRADAWVHVDGAFGLWAGASARKRSLYAGVNKADSWSADAHKTLNAPYDCGIILCRQRGALASAMQASASYLQWSEDRDNMIYTPDMSRRARAVELWATMKSLGRSGIEALVDQLCDHAVYFADRLRALDFKILNDVVFNQLLVACESPAVTRGTLEHIQHSGECWCGGAVWHGEPVIRVSVCSWRTSKDDIDRSINAFIEARAQAQDA